MPETVGITKAVTNLTDVRDKLNLSQTDDPQFFTEWFEELPELTDSEKESLNRLKNRYLYYVADGAITESRINMMMLSPLLELMRLFDPPFKLRAEEMVKVEIANGGREEPVLEGFIDALVVQNLFWMVVIESKRYGLSVLQALPQTLTYMMANPNSEKPVFGMIINGEDYVFIKLTKQGMPKYALSDKFTLVKQSHNDLYEVIRVMKKIISACVHA